MQHLLTLCGSSKTADHHEVQLLDLHLLFNTKKIRLRSYLIYNCIFLLVGSGMSYFLSHLIAFFLLLTFENHPLTDLGK